VTSGIIAPLLIRDYVRSTTSSRTSRRAIETFAASPLGVVGHTHAIDASVNIGRDESGHVANGLIGRTSQQRDKCILLRWLNGEHIDDGDDVSACTDVSHRSFLPFQQMQVTIQNPNLTLYVAS
jgi:hypothetical protein